MNDNDKNLKDMWNKANYSMGISGYDVPTIKRFLSSRSNTIAEKFRKMMQLDIGIKLAITLMLIFDVVLYFSVQPIIAYVCAAALILIIPLIVFEYNILNQFSEITDSVNNTKDKLAGMLSFLKRRSFITLLSTASTYLFGFNAAMLVYFFAAYGELKDMGSLDIFVFPSICLIGIIVTYVQNNTIIKYQLKHIELCLSDLNEDILPLVSQNIETQQKTDKTMNVLVTAIVFLAFLALVFVLKKMGF